MTELTRLRDDLGRFTGAIRSTNPVEIAAEEARLMIVRRTRSGRDRHGAAFEPYAESTRRRKRKQGRASTIVTLSATGDMLDRMTVAVGSRGSSRTAAGVVFGTRRDERLARIHAGDGPRTKIPLRDFAGLTPREAEAILRRYGAAVDRILPRDRRRRATITVRL